MSLASSAKIQLPGRRLQAASMVSVPVPVAVRRPVVARNHVMIASKQQWAQSKQQYQRSRNLVVVQSSTPTSFLTTAEEEEDFDKLGDAVKDVTKVVDAELKGCTIWLVGMMGCGKSTVGKMLANTLKYTFFDSDSLIEKAHDGKSCADLFAEYGQEYFRNAETQTLKELAPYKNLIIATGGGAVIKPMNWGYMRQGIVVWLNGDVDLLARRIAADGVQKRPLIAEGLEKPEDASDPEKVIAAARKKVEAIMSDRTKYYENADVMVSLSGTGADAKKGAPAAVVMLRLLRGIEQKIKERKEEQARMRDFTIEGADSLKTMRTVESPVPPKEQ